MTTRWTVRSVEDGIVEQVRALHEQSGFSLGEIVSASLRHGLAAAYDELASRPSEDLPFHVFLRRIRDRLSNQKAPVRRLVRLKHNAILDRQAKPA
jgi:hypothetical protein